MSEREPESSVDRRHFLVTTAKVAGGAASSAVVAITSLMVATNVAASTGLEMCLS
jgi:nitrous oxide reductase